MSAWTFLDRNLFWIVLIALCCVFGSDAESCHVRIGNTEVVGK